MKTTIKKLIPLLVITGTLAGCSMYSSKPGPVEDLVGLYELEIIKKKHNKDDENTYDYKREIQAKAYFTINKEGYGFYGYKDKNSKAKVSQIYSNFGYDTTNEEHPEYVKSVLMGDLVSQVGGEKKEVGCLDEPTLGFHDTTLKKYLAYTIPYDTWTTIILGHKHTYEQFYQYVQYKKIGTDTSLKKINSLMGTNVSFKRPIEMNSHQRFQIYNCSPNEGSESSRFGIYDYVVIDTETYLNGKMKIYYSLKDSGANKVDLIPVTISEKGRQFTTQIFGKTYKGSIYKGGRYQGLELSDYQYTDSDPYINEYFSSYRGQKTTIAEVIAECKSGSVIV